MKKVSFLLVIFLGMIHGHLLAQFEWDPTTANSLSAITRFNVTGIGFPTAATAATAAGGRSFFVVDGTANAPNGNIMAHWLGGQVGPFTSGNTWCGLGEGNPGGPVTPYGLAMAKGGSVGFYNLFPGSAGEDVIAGFGVATGTNANRFRIRSYDNASSFTTGDDILIANPRGTVSINSEPQQSGPDLSTALYVDGRDGATSAAFRSIFIQNNTITTPGGLNFESFSAIGEEGNTAVINTPVEGFRSQFVNTTSTSVFERGTAVNLQVLRNPTPAVPPVVDAVAFALGGELADLYWQDLGYTGPASTDLLVLPPATAQSLDKFFISFRNADPGGPFVAGNRLPVMQFQANGRVGIGQAAGVSPISTSGLTPIFLDVAAGIFATAGFITSDRRLKKDIQPVDNAMDLVRRLQGTTYVFRTDEFPGKNLPMGRQYGFIAQDLEKVIPEAAQQCDNGFYAVNYDAIIPSFVV